MATRIDRRTSFAVVERCYRGHGFEAARVLISGARRGFTRCVQDRFDGAASSSRSAAT